MGTHGGKRVKHRDRKKLALARLIADIKEENKHRVEAIAAARGESIAVCIDEMIEADWARRCKLAGVLPNSYT